MSQIVKTKEIVQFTEIEDSQDFQSIPKSTNSEMLTFTSDSLLTTTTTTTTTSTRESNILKDKLPGPKWGHLFSEVPAVKKWEALEDSRWERSWAIEGAIWPLEEAPKQFKANPPFYPFNEKTRGILVAEVKELLALGKVQTYGDYKLEKPQKRYSVVRTFTATGVQRMVIPLTLRPWCLSPLGVVPKKNSEKLRIILNLMRVLVNESARKVTFTIDPWEAVAHTLIPGTYLASLDLADGFHHILVKWDYRQLLGFHLELSFNIFG
jgi:hypothetical protein